MANALQDAHDFFAANRPNKTLGLYLFKKVYIMLAAQFVDNIDGLDSKKDETLINVYRDQFKSKLAWITNSCEYILSDIYSGNTGDDYVMRGMVMLAVGANFSPSSNIKEESTNKFALNVCDHYTKCYALASNKVTVNCHVIECDESLVGQTVELVNGMSADLKLVVKDKFKKEKVKVQVVKEQVELLHPDGTTEMKEEIKVKYTERIVAPKHNSNMASLLVNAETIDEVNSNGEVVVDAGGNARKTVNNEILADVLKGKYATAIITFDGERDQEVMYLTSTTGEVVELPMCEEDFTDMEKEVVYSIGSSFLAGEGKYGVVAMQLNKESK